MTELEATEAVYAVAVAGVAAMNPAPQLVLDEHGKPTAGTLWIRLVVRDQPSPPASHGTTGGRHVQRRGTVYAQCFYPVATKDGVGPSLALAQAVRALFEGKTLTAAAGALNFAEANVQRRGVEGGWTQTDAICPFTFDATF